MTTEAVAEKIVKCYHCGEHCEETLWLDRKTFCCYGCRTVYEILSFNQLCEYYVLDKNPGLQQKQTYNESYRYLDEKDVRKKILEFESENFSFST